MKCRNLVRDEDNGQQCPNANNLCFMDQIQKAVCIQNTPPVGDLHIREP